VLSVCQLRVVISQVANRPAWGGFPVPTEQGGRALALPWILYIHDLPDPGIDLKPTEASENTTDFFDVDNEPFEMMPISVSLLPKKIRLFSAL
jgi:hypothetical protein